MSRKTLSTPQAPVSRRALVGPKIGRLLKAPRSAATAESRVLGAFKVVEAQEVRAFLAEHPFLEAILAEAATQLRDYFPVAPLGLRVRHDADGHDPAYLVLYATTHLDAKAARDLMDEFDDKWWLDNFDRARDLLTITLAFA